MESLAGYQNVTYKARSDRVEQWTRYCKPGTRNYHKWKVGYVGEVHDDKIWLLPDNGDPSHGAEFKHAKARQHGQ